MAVENKFQRIFVAIDFSPGADEALRQASSRAASTGAKLAVCHIVPSELPTNLLFPQESPIAAMNIPLELERAAEAVVTRVKDVTGRLEDQFEVLVDDGTPYAAILDAAENWIADLIVMGSHGMTSSAGVLIGSVTHKVIQYAHCPVLIVRRGGGTGRIVAGTDFSDPALPALRAAAEEARRTGGELTIVHSLDDTWPAAAYAAMAFGGAPFDVSAEEVQRMEDAAGDRLKETLDRLAIKAETQVARGPAGAALVDIASELKADLVVVGTVGRTGLRRMLLGSVAEAVATKAPCSVLVVRLRPAGEHGARDAAA